MFFVFGLQFHYEEGQSVSQSHKRSKTFLEPVVELVWESRA